MASSDLYQLKSFLMGVFLTYIFLRNKDKKANYKQIDIIQKLK